MGMPRHARRIQVGYMNNHQISPHLLRVYQAAETDKGWITSQELAALANVSPRTARNHALHLVTMGIFDVAKVSPAHCYRVSEFARSRNPSYFNQLQQAKEIFDA